MDSVFYGRFTNNIKETRLKIGMQEPSRVRQEIRSQFVDAEDDNGVNR